MMRRDSKGVSALPTILLISSIIVEISVALALLSNALVNTRFSERLTAEALLTARSGAQDAILRIERYKNCPSSPNCPGTYSLSVGSNTADVTITNDSAGRITVMSTGIAKNRQKKVEVILGVDTVTGETELQSFNEVPL